MGFSLWKILQYFDKPWKITLASIFVSVFLSGWLSYLFSGNILMGILIGGFVASIVAYPVSYFIIQTQQQLRLQNARLKQLNDELETYNRVLAHDIKNKVSVISLSSYMIAKTIDTDDKRYQHAMNIKTSSDDLNKLVKSLLSQNKTYKQEIIQQGKDKTES